MEAILVELKNLNVKVPLTPTALSKQINVDLKDFYSLGLTYNFKH